MDWLYDHIIEPVREEFAQLRYEIKLLWEDSIYYLKEQIIAVLNWLKDEFEKL